MEPNSIKAPYNADELHGRGPKESVILEETCNLEDNKKIILRKIMITG